MIIHGQFYDGIVGKPDIDDALEHYGVKGMKWRKVKAKITGKIKQLRNGNKKMTKDQQIKYVNSHLRDDLKDHLATNYKDSAKSSERTRATTDFSHAKSADFHGFNLGYDIDARRKEEYEKRGVWKKKK